MAGPTDPGRPCTVRPVEHDYVAVLAEAEQVLDEVDQALARLGNGTYGTCEACGVAIDEERLAAMPTARSCGGHPQLTDRVIGPGPAEVPIDPDLDAALGFGSGPDGA